MRKFNATPAQSGVSIGQPSSVAQQLSTYGVHVTERGEEHSARAKSTSFFLPPLSGAHRQKRRAPGTSRSVEGLGGHVLPVPAAAARAAADTSSPVLEGVRPW